MVHDRMLTVLTDPLDANMTMMIMFECFTVSEVQLDLWF
jgi:hypothetical protein